MVDADQVRSVIERHFRVYEAREEKFDAVTSAHLFFVMFPQEEFDRRYEAVRHDIKSLDEELMVFMRREGGEDVLFVAPRPEGGPEKNRTNVILLIATMITTATAGAVFWEGFAHPGADWRWSVFWDPANLLWGFVTFALPLMFILGVHETAHFIAAKRHGIRATLPYFIPVPPILFFPIGTFGAFIRMKDPLPDRKALFDVGASGPLAGFAVAVPLLFIGTVLTDEAAVEVPDFDRPDIVALEAVHDESETGLTVLEWPATPGIHTFTITSPEDDWVVTLTATVTADDGPIVDRSQFTLDEGEVHMGTITIVDGATSARVEVMWDDQLIRFGDPLLVMGVDKLLGAGDYLTHPTFFAAWVGILITGINLLPAGQLDGGHVARAVLGDRVRYAGMFTLGVLMFLAFRFSSWILMALFLILTGLYHPPPLNDRTPLDNRRKAVAAFVLIVFAVTFVPVPIIV